MYIDHIYNLWLGSGKFLHKLLIDIVVYYAEIPSIFHFVGKNMNPLWPLKAIFVLCSCSSKCKIFLHSSQILCRDEENLSHYLRVTIPLFRSSGDWLVMSIPSWICCGIFINNVPFHFESNLFGGHNYMYLKYKKYYILYMVRCIMRYMIYDVCLA